MSIFVGVQRNLSENIIYFVLNQLKIVTKHFIEF
jgi:hypothetical protein